jgi:hypothetical protein
MYLDLANDEPIYLGQSKSIRNIRKRAKVLAEALGTEVRDLTED